MTEERRAATNTGFASGGVTCKLEAMCFYSSSVQVDSLVLRNPPERKALFVVRKLNDNFITMTYFDFADKYFEERKDTYEAIRALSEKRNIKLFDKLFSDKNEINFMSWLSEMKFGLRLDKVFQTLSYENKINNQTPDWFVTSNEQALVFEVVRINLQEQELSTKIDEFKTPKIQDNIVATLKYSEGLDSQYFYGNIDKISKKEIAYRNIVEQKNYPLIICVDSSEIDLFTSYNDFYDFFIADGKHGYFKKNISFGKNVSALFVQVPFDGYKLIVNENCKNKLNEQNLNLIKQLCD